MLPTLKPGQNVLCFNWAYIFIKPQVGDMVVIKKNNRKIVKRIQKYTKQGIFIVGDNKAKSTDSRSFGLVNQSQLLGKIIWHK